MSWAIQLVIALSIFAAGAAGGIKWELGVQARAELAAQQALESDAIQQRKFGDKAAGDHAATLAKLNNQLGYAREKIALLSGRQCLDAGTIGVLNSIGDSVPAAASEPASAPTTAAAGTGLRFATERDVAGYIALCRARYREVAGQLNEILDIEGRRQAPEK